jgi:hypothetical protein
VRVVSVALERIHEVGENGKAFSAERLEEEAREDVTAGSRVTSGF